MSSPVTSGSINGHIQMGMEAINRFVIILSHKPVNVIPEEIS